MQIKNFEILLFAGLWLCARASSEVKIADYSGNQPVVFNSIGLLKDTLHAKAIFNLNCSRMLDEITRLKLKYLEVKKKETCQNNLNCAQHSSFKFSEVSEICNDIIDLSQTSSILEKPTRKKRFAGLILTPIVALNTIGLIALAVEVSDINAALKSLQANTGTEKEILNRMTDELELLLEMSQNMSRRLDIIEDRIDNIEVLNNIDESIEIVRNYAHIMNNEIFLIFTIYQLVEIKTLRTLQHDETWKARNRHSFNETDEGDDGETFIGKRIPINTEQCG